MKARSLAPWAGAAVACFAGFVGLVADVRSSGAVAALDAPVMAAVHAMRAGWLTAVMRLVTESAGTIVMASASVTLAASAWIRGSRRRAATIAAIMAGGMLASTGAKAVVGRARPPVDGALVAMSGSASLPSGHSMAAVLFAASVVYLAMRSGVGRVTRAAVAAGSAVWALSVGVSRVYLGVHWPTDVCASWLLGGAWIALVFGVAGLSASQEPSPSQTPA